MALISCPECKEKISTTADHCPKCGFKLSPDLVTEIEKIEQKDMATGLAVSRVFAIIMIALIASVFIFSIIKSVQDAIFPEKKTLQSQTSGSNEDRIAVDNRIYWESVIVVAIMACYNIETQCSILDSAGIYSFNIIQLTPGKLAAEQFITLVGASVGFVCEVLNKNTEWKSDYLYIQANGKKWRVKTSSCMDALTKVPDDAKSLGAYFRKRIELVK